MFAYAIAVVGFAIVIFQIWQDRVKYPLFKAMTRTEERQGMYRYWTIDAFMRYGMLGLVGLFLLHRQSALGTMPPDFLSAWRDAAERLGINPLRFEALGVGLSGGILIGTFAVSLMPLLMRRFGGKTPQLTGDIAALIPRNRAEIRWGVAISLNAGVVEEIFFRLLMPFAWFAITGNAVTALLISVVLFGLVHAYQGVIGVFATMAIGVVLTLVYLATQQIWLAILLHAVIDLRVLVFLPLAQLNESASEPTNKQ